jgi:EAL domain-containing protein (putative c-di-GMP-specific phosphodiesterase class I)/CheY-like chemotaxis protein
MDTSGLTFLVVEDEDFQRSMLLKLLGSLNAKSVHAAANGREGLKLLQALAAPVDVIISDLDMPAMDGMEFMRHVGAMRFGNSFIVASAVERSVLDSMDMMAKAYGINFLGAIEKPVTRRKLEAMLRNRKAAAPGAGLQAPSLSFTLEEIVRGLEGDEIEAFFQPKVEIATGRAVGMEALARWRHPQHGIVSPYYFIRQLEDAGRIDDVMRCVLGKGAEFVRELREHGHDCFVAVNVSIHSLHDVGIADEITGIVRHHGVPPRSIVLEVTESAAATDIGRVLENLARLRMKGFELSIDDYGTGYSSLEQLMRIPFTELKIDQSFVMNAQRNQSARVILASTLDLARRLKLRVVAEGVETKASWDLLRELECDIAQGYYVSRPLGVEAYREWLDSWARAHAPPSTAVR